ncbi:MAG: hypothetical protein Q8O87_02450 [bacterium]|nr:hypothetical protein [bacterium]
MEITEQSHAIFTLHSCFQLLAILQRIKNSQPNSAERKMHLKSLEAYREVVNNIYIMYNIAIEDQQETRPEHEVTSKI